MASNLCNVLVYSSNNSGGSWWLTDESWAALEDAGWVVHWQHPHEQAHGDVVHEVTEYTRFGGHHHSYEHELIVVERPDFETGERWLGALAQSAALATTDPEAGIAQWEAVTGMSSTEEGCNCCGEPHNFTFYDADGKRRYSSIEVVQTERTWS